MYTKIDWYSFTIPNRAPIDLPDEETINYAIIALGEYITDTALTNSFKEGWNVENATGFYCKRARHEPTGIAVSFGSVNPHLFVELSGKGCDALESVDCLERLVQATHSRASRIDLAIDWETETTPEQFSSCRNEIRWKHLSTINSATGQTCYVGSRKGQRMARIYRYNEPHPRSKFLRCEAEYKGEAAKAAAAEIGLRPLHEVVRDVHSVFGWHHALITQGLEGGKKIAYSAHSPENAATVLWLYSVVVGSIKRARDLGLIDWEEFKKRVEGQPSAI